MVRSYLKLSAPPPAPPPILLHQCILLLFTSSPLISCIPYFHLSPQLHTHLFTAAFAYFFLLWKACIYSVLLWDLMFCSVRIAYFVQLCSPCILRSSLWCLHSQLFCTLQPMERWHTLFTSVAHEHCTAKNQYRKFETNIPRKGIARPQS